jgi:ribosomal protein S18 acetylase RimI-like enzyme
MPPHPAVLRRHAVTRVWLRPATTSDLTGILDLSVLVMGPQLERVLDFDAQRHRDDLRRSFDPATMRVILSDAGTIGCIAAEPHPDHTAIHSFCVAPAWQGHGIGGRVLAAMLAERPVLPHRLEVVKHSRAIAFYQRAGFRIIADGGFEWGMERPAS